MKQPEEWLAVSLVVLCVLIVSFAKGMIKADGVLLDPMVFVCEREEHERHGHWKGQCGYENGQLPMINAYMRSMSIGRVVLPTRLLSSR